MNTNIDEKVVLYIIEWIKRRNPYILSKIIFFCSIWVVMSICFVSTCGQVGFGMMNTNITEQHAAGIITDDSYNQWVNLIIPIISVAFMTMHIIIFITIGMSFILLYLTFMRYKKD